MPLRHLHTRSYEERVRLLKNIAEITRYPNWENQFCQVPGLEKKPEIETPELQPKVADISCLIPKNGRRA